MQAPKWMVRVLAAASVFNVLLGGLLLFAPDTISSWMGLGTGMDPTFEQALGLVVAVLGLGYGLAAVSPFKHWNIVLVGWALQTVALAAFGLAEWRGSLPPRAFWVVAAANLVWWAPFLLMLRASFEDHVADHGTGEKPAPPQRAMLRLMSPEGFTLYELSQIRPTLVVFLRHAGCTFCREALADLKDLRPEIEDQGTGLAFVHMSAEPEAQAFFESYEMGDVPRFSDPECRLYRAFELKRGTWSQLFGWKVWLRGFSAGLLGGHGVGAIDGDSFRMPGVFLVRDGRVVREYRHESAAERPDYLALARYEEPLVVESFGQDEDLETVSVGVRKS